MPTVSMYCWIVAAAICILLAWPSTHDTLIPDELLAWPCAHDILIQDEHVTMLAGSSSGPAVAVASRVAPFALCEDTGGTLCSSLLHCAYKALHLAVMVSQHHALGADCHLG